jgi:hypothetical protein
VLLILHKAGGEPVHLQESKMTRTFLIAGAVFVAGFVSVAAGASVPMRPVSVASSVDAASWLNGGTKPVLVAGKDGGGSHDGSGGSHDGSGGSRDGGRDSGGRGDGSRDSGGRDGNGGRDGTAPSASPDPNGSHDHHHHDHHHHGHHHDGTAIG